MAEEMRFTNNWSRVEGDDYETTLALDTAHSPAQFTPLPKRVECDGQTVNLGLKKGELGVFLSGYWLSADGRIAGIYGGWIAAPLAGGEGACYFTRVNNTWERTGCLGMSQI